MPLVAGTRLGPYEILAPIGAGGMGEVWRARDAKLGRDVALKILPVPFENDPERLARFQREARLLASLDHPNIGHIYGLEESDGVRALVLALIEGPTLADKIAAGPLGEDDAKAIALQIAEAFEYAHDRGVIHRDLKPANIKITPDGVVKVLDFGLAKALEDESTTSSGLGTPQGQSPTMLPTMTLGGTQPGMILGTAAYISPEQVKGKRADRKSDVWAFGVVLYEMLVGKRPFEGESIGELLVNVAKDEPKLEAVPERFRALVARCLEKDPRKRVQSFGEARQWLEDLEGRGVSSGAVAQADLAPRSSTGLAGRMGWIAAAVLAVGAGVVSLVHFREKPPVERPLQLAVPLPPGSNASYLDLSPDGQSIVMSANRRNGTYGLLVRSLASPELRDLAAGGTAPFWSPDSRSIGFFGGGKLKTMSARGGPAQELCEAIGYGGTWNRDGVILFPDARGSIEQTQASGGACVALTKPEGDAIHRVPVFLPDGNHFLYLALQGQPAKRGLYVAALNDPTGKRLLPDESSAVYSPLAPGAKRGHLLFLRDTTLMAQGFNEEALTLEGDVFPVVTEATRSGATGQVAAAVSANGTLVYLSNGVSNQKYEVTWFDHNGRPAGTEGAPGSPRVLSLSPDGKTLAYDVGIDREIWLRDLVRGIDTRLVNGVVTSPVWAPDSRRLAFTFGKDIYGKQASGAQPEEALVKNANQKYPADWSPDGRALLYTEIDPKTGADLWVLPNPSAAAGEKPIPFLRTEANETQGQFSPDGRWVAYVSNESGKDEVYVRPYPTGAAKWKISAGGGVQPRWSHDRKEIYYLSLGFPKHTLYAASVRAVSAQEFTSSAPKPLFELRAGLRNSTMNQFQFSPTPDGQRFLVTLLATDYEPVVNVVTNWRKTVVVNDKAAGE